MKKGADKHSHSWWWDSHISPKNSKWLEENLEVMDANVKTMLKLIEADGDSFAKKAEMYYKKRPELVKLVEEFYRMHRAVAERYDNLTGEIKKNMPSSLKEQYAVSSDSSPSSKRAMRSKSKRRAAGFDVFLRSSSKDHSHKSEESTDNSTSASSSDSESVNPLKLHVELKRLEEIEKQRTEFDRGKKEYDLLQQKARELQEGILKLEGENEILRKEAEGESGYKSNLKEQISRLETRNCELESQLRSMCVQEEDSTGKINMLQEKNEQLSEELQAKAKTVQDLEREIKDMQEKLNSSREENDILKLDFQRCHQNCEVAERQIREAENGSSTQKQQIYLLEVEIDNMKHRFMEMHEENNLLSMQNETGNQKLNYAETLIKSLQDEMLELQREKDKLRIEATGIDEQEKSFQEKISFLQEDNSRLKSEVTMMQHCMKDHQVEISQLLMERDSMRKEALEQMDSLRDQIKVANELEKRIEELQLALLDSQKENMRLTGEHNRIIDECGVVNGRLKALHEELSNTQEENERLRKETSAKIITLMEENKQLKAELLLKTNIMEGMEEELNDTKNQNWIFSSKLEALNQEQKGQIKTLEETIILLQEHNKTLSDQLMGSFEKNSVLEIRLKNQEEENRGLRIDLADIRIVVQKLDKDMHVLESEKAALVNEISLGKGQIHILQQKCRSFKGDAEELSVSLQDETGKQKTFNEEIFELEQLIVHVEKDYINLKIESHKVGEEREKFKKELAGLQNELKLIHSKNTSLQLEITSKEELVRKLNEDNCYLHGENAKLTTRLSDGVDQIQKLENGCREYRNNMQEMDQLKDGENLFLQDSLHNMQQENENFRHELQNACKERESLERELSCVKKELLQLQDTNFRFEEQISSKDDSIQRLKDKEDMLWRKNEYLEAELTHVCMQKSELEKDAFTQSELNVELEGQISSLNKKAKILENDICLFRDDNSRLTNLSQMQTVEMENLRLEVENQQNEINKLSTNHQRGLEELQIGGKKVEQLQHKLCQLEIENEELKNLLSVKINLIQELQDQVSSLEQEKMVLKYEVQFLTQKVGNLQSLTAKLQEYKEKTSEALEIDHEHVQKLEVEIQELKQLTHTINVAKTMLEVDCQEVHEQLGGCQCALEKLHQEHSGLAYERSCLVSEISSQKACISELKGQLLSLQQESSAKAEGIISWIHLGAKLRKELSHLQEERIKLQNEFLYKMAQFKDDVKRLQEAFNRLKEDNMKMKEECQTVMENCHSVLKREENLQEEKMALEEKSQYLLEDLGKAEERLNLLQKEVSSLQEENSHLSNTASKTVRVTQKLQEEICILESEKSSLQNETTHKVVEIEKLNEQVAHICSERNSFKNQLKVKEEQTNQLELEIDRRKNDLMSFDERNKLLLEESCNCVDEKNALETRTAKIQQEAFERTQQIKTLEFSVSNLQTENKKLESKGKLNMEQILGLQKHLEDLHLEHVSLISASQADRRQIEELLMKVGKLEKEVKVLREESERQSIIIFDRAEEKREAIRQLCFSIDHFKHNYKHLQQILSMVLHNQNRTASS